MRLHWGLMISGLGLIASLVVLGLSLAGPWRDSAERQKPVSMQPTETDWLVIPDLPADATQAEVGAEVYRLVCQDCHGDRGQGLTPDWIAQWPVASQNCWQSKCHASNHPPEGFLLPRYVPPLLEPGALSEFQTALDLYTYIRANMPWYAPGSLSDQRYWQLTAYLVREYSGVQMTSPLTRAQAASVRLRPAPSSPQ